MRCIVAGRIGLRVRRGLREAIAAVTVEAHAGGIDLAIDLTVTVGVLRRSRGAGVPRVLEGCSATRHRECNDHQERKSETFHLLRFLLAPGRLRERGRLRYPFWREHREGEARMKLGDKLDPWRVIAKNDASDSGNEIHSDDVAAKYGFRGGLVPGITVYGYMTGPIVAGFGDAWLDRGGMRVRLRRPVYEDEPVEVVAEVSKVGEGRREIEVVARNGAGEDCAVGSAWLLDDAAPPPDSLPPRGAIPAERIPPTREALEGTPVLGTTESVWESERVGAYLDAMQDTNAIYQDGVVHPAYLLRLANLVVDRSVAVNPWIHVSSDLQHHRRAQAGEILETRAKVVRCYEKNGHEYADFDMAILAREAGASPEAGTPVLTCLHCAIVRPRPV